jgi:hypothetical protein
MTLQPSRRKHFQQAATLTTALFLLAGALLACFSCPAAGLIWPISGSSMPDPMTTSFGPRVNNQMWDMHDGVDLPGAVGTPLHACQSGVVRKAGMGGTDGISSNHVVVEGIDALGNPLFIYYLHLASVAVVTGTAVAQGQVIGGLGADDATYPHCHLEIRGPNSIQENSVHPLNYLPYTGTANFSAPVADRFNRLGGFMAARLLFGASDRNEGDLGRVEVDLMQGPSLLGQRMVDLGVKANIQEGNSDAFAFSDDIALEGYQVSNMTQYGWGDLKQGVVLRNIPPQCDGLVARVKDLDGHAVSSTLVAVPNQAAFNLWAGFEDGSVLPSGFTLVTQTTGTGTQALVSAAAGHGSGMGLLCQDFSSTESAAQHTGMECALAVGRFEWRSQAWVNPISLGLAEGDSLYPLAFFFGPNLSVAARIRRTGGVLYAGLLAKNPDGTLTGAESPHVIAISAWRQWGLSVIRIGTRTTTAILLLDGVEADRLTWDSSVYEPQRFRAGIALSSAGATAEVAVDDVAVFEDPSFLFPGPAAPATPQPSLGLRFTSNLGRTVLAPVPCRQGERVFAHFTAEPISTEWLVLNMAGDAVVHASFAKQENHCLDTSVLAPGIYLVRMKWVAVNGEASVVTQKISVVR